MGSEMCIRDSPSPAVVYLQLSVVVAVVADAMRLSAVLLRVLARADGIFFYSYYGPPQGQYGGPQQYGPPQGQYPPQGYGAPPPQVRFLFPVPLDLTNPSSLIPYLSPPPLLSFRPNPT